MGRIAGVTAQETRDRVLRGAGSVFARLGYDGASIAEIASAAGLSSGAIYAHFGSKADLFAATLHARGPAEMARLLAVDRTGAEGMRFVRDRGVGLARRHPEDGSLLVEAIVAAKRHPDVAALLVSALAEREEGLAELVRAGQQAGTVDESIRPAAVARLMLMLVLGSLLAAAVDLPPVDERDWAELIDDLFARLNAPRPPA